MLHFLDNNECEINIGKGDCNHSCHNSPVDEVDVDGDVFHRHTVTAKITRPTSLFLM